MTIDSAIIFATECHKGQTRKYSNLPYIVHPLAVMNTLIACGYKNENLLSAAILHDVVEDCKITRIEIANKFNHQIATFVSDVTKSPMNYRGDTRMEKWQYYLNDLDSKDVLSKALKVADRYCNIKDYFNSWNQLSDNEKKFVCEVYVLEAEMLLQICIRHKCKAFKNTLELLDAAIKWSELVRS